METLHNWLSPYQKWIWPCCSILTKKKSPLLPGIKPKILGYSPVGTGWGWDMAGNRLWRGPRPPVAYNLVTTLSCSEIAHASLYPFVALYCNQFCICLYASLNFLQGRNRGGALFLLWFYSKSSKFVHLHTVYLMLLYHFLLAKCYDHYPINF